MILVNITKSSLGRSHAEKRRASCGPRSLQRCVAPRTSRGPAEPSRLATEKNTHRQGLSPSTHALLRVARRTHPASPQHVPTHRPRRARRRREGVPEAGLRHSDVPPPSPVPAGSMRRDDRGVEPVRGGAATARAGSNPRRIHGNPGRRGSKENGEKLVIFFF